MNRKYSGFTLVEMLIVMGIIIILMVVGITAGRFAINRANDVAHKNAVDQVYTSLQAYYTDNREYPTNQDCGDAACTVESLVSNGAAGYLVPYIDQDSFDGGSEATYFYGVGGDGGDQAVLVCVSLRGNADDNADRDDGEIYCNGNGFGTEVLSGLPIAVTTGTLKNTAADHTIVADFTSANGVTWDNGF